MEVNFRKRNPGKLANIYYNIHPNMMKKHLNIDLGRDVIKYIKSSRIGIDEYNNKHSFILFIVNIVKRILNQHDFCYQNINDYFRLVYLFRSSVSKIEAAECDVDIAIEIPARLAASTFLLDMHNLLITYHS